MSNLFDPIVLTAPQGNGLALRNRAFVAPMCQYSATHLDGVPTNWHLQHYGALAAGGFSLVVVEATGVLPEGRISPLCLGLYDDKTEAGHARLVEMIHSLGASAGIQLGHAGGKASTYPHLPGTPTGTVPAHEGGWEPNGVSNTPVMPDMAAPRALDIAGINRLVAGFVDSAERADQAGYDVIQLHAAHGYVLHQFLSPLTNTRTDEYGGCLSNRARLLREVVAAVREVWPAHKPLGIRVSATDWAADGLDVGDVGQVLHKLAVDFGVTWVDVSSGGLSSGGTIPVGPAYQVPLAGELTRTLADTNVVVSAVGMLAQPQLAESVIATGQAHAVSIGRPALANPHWASAAAYALRDQRAADFVQPQYWRAHW